MGGGLLETNNQQERKTKKLLGILGIGLVIGVVNVRAITSHEVTYENQGVTENLTETLDKLYRELKEYKTSGSVTSTEMLEGSTGYAKGKLVTGSIKRKEAQTYIPGTTDQTISSGQYLNGDQIVKGDVHLVASNIKSGISLFGVAGTFTSDANAEANQILSGKTAYVKGNKITGSIGSKGSTTYTPGVNNQTISKGQYLSENQVILGDADLKAANIKNGVEIFGVTGTFTSDANAIANQILSGKTAYVQGNKITGSMSNKAGATVTASTTTSDATYTYVTIPAAGYYDTSSKVKVENNKLSGEFITFKGYVKAEMVNAYYPKVTVNLYDSSGKLIKSEMATGEYQGSISKSVTGVIQGHQITINGSTSYQNKTADFSATIDNKNFIIKNNTFETLLYKNGIYYLTIQ